FFLIKNECFTSIEKEYNFKYKKFAYNRRFIQCDSNLYYCNNKKLFKLNTNLNVYDFFYYDNKLYLIVKYKNSWDLFYVDTMRYCKKEKIYNLDEKLILKKKEKLFGSENYFFKINNKLCRLDIYR